MICGAIIGCAMAAVMIAMLFALIVWPIGSRYRAAVRRFEAAKREFDELMRRHR